MNDMPSTSAQVAEESARVRGLMHELEAQVLPRAASLDGQDFAFVAPVAMMLPTGGYIMLQTSEGPALGQIRESAIEYVDGPEVSVSSGAYSGARMQTRFAHIVGSGTMLESGVPFHDAPFAPAEPAEVAEWLVTMQIGRAHV